MTAKLRILPRRGAGRPHGAEQALSFLEYNVKFHAPTGWRKILYLNWALIWLADGGG